MMKYKPWLKLAAWIMPFLLIGAVFMTQAQSGRSNWPGMYQIRRIATKLKIPLPPPHPLTAAEKKEATAEVAAWKAKFLLEFPALRVTERSVPAEENGFLQLYQLGSDLPISKEFSDILEKVDTCDLKVAKRCLAEHAELVEKIERIARLTTRSSTGMPSSYRGFLSLETRRFGEILLLKARSAATQGDEKQALQWITKAGNILDHFGKLEAPTMLSETICIVSDLRKLEVVSKTLLPALGKSADLAKWKLELGRKMHSSADLANVMRGEWQMCSDFLFFQTMAISEKTAELPDPEAVTHCYTECFNDAVVKLPSLGLGEMAKAFTISTRTGKLSGAGRDMMDLVTQGFAEWLKGYARAAIISAQTQAVLDLLILEKSGVTLTSADAGRVTRDPVTGLPFIFDTASRKVSAPASAAATDVKELALPW